MDTAILWLGLAVATLLGLQQQRPVAVTPDPDRGPRIAFDTTVHDYGTIPVGADGACSFRFTNTGDAPLIIESFKSTCGCLVPSHDPGPVAPGGSGTVRLRYDTNRPGPFNKVAIVTCNAMNTPSIVLRVRGAVAPGGEKRLPDR